MDKNVYFKYIRGYNVYNFFPDTAATNIKIGNIIPSVLEYRNNLYSVISNIVNKLDTTGDNIYYDITSNEEDGLFLPAYKYWNKFYSELKVISDSAAFVADIDNIQTSITNIYNGTGSNNPVKSKKSDAVSKYIGQSFNNVEIGDVFVVVGKMYKYLCRVIDKDLTTNIITSCIYAYTSKETDTRGIASDTPEKRFPRPEGQAVSNIYKFIHPKFIESDLYISRNTFRWLNSNSNNYINLSNINNLDVHFGKYPKGKYYVTHGSTTTYSSTVNIFHDDDIYESGFLTDFYMDFIDSLLIYPVEYIKSEYMGHPNFSVGVVYGKMHIPSIHNICGYKDDLNKTYKYYVRTNGISTEYDLDSDSISAQTFKTGLSLGEYYENIFNTYNGIDGIYRIFVTRDNKINSSSYNGQSACVARATNDNDVYITEYEDVHDLSEFENSKDIYQNFNLKVAVSTTIPAEVIVTPIFKLQG